MDYAIFDIETGGLVSNKIHCLVKTQFRNGRETVTAYTDYSSMKRAIEEEDILVGHNIVRFDIPELERLLNFKVKARLIDTLALSWYLYPWQPKHGLDEWGEFFGIQKPPINDWQNLPVGDYVYRCTEDNKINKNLFHMQVANLRAIYLEDGIDRIMNYLTWKMDCAREQEQVKWKVDAVKCKDGLALLQAEEAVKVQALQAAIPDNILYRVVKRPKVPFKKDGSQSANGKKWFDILEELGLPPTYQNEIKVIAGFEKGNPGSHTQLKRWLESLGWEPQTFKYAKDEDHKITRKIPQINNIEGTGVCPSVKLLFEKEPALENLEGLSVIRHRIGILKGFLRDVDADGFIKAEIAGLTNTLRFQHKTVVNLPKVSRAYGDLIRGCLIAPDDDHVLCGSDMSSLEDTTKQHYMYYYDPEYVKQMRVPGFDPHLSIAVFAGMITEDDSNFYKWYDQIAANNAKYLFEGKDEELYAFNDEQKARYKKIKKIRGDAKVVNFSAVYGVGAAKMSLTTGWPISKSKKLLEAYWQLNHAVKKIANACSIRIVNKQMWLYNSVSKLWYSLRFEKDKFSTLNQGTGVYCFDMNIKNVRKRGIKMCGQFHDEHAEPVRKGMEERHRQLLQEAIDETNKELQLNVPLGISVDFGHSYADIH